MTNLLFAKNEWPSPPTADIPASRNAADDKRDLGLGFSNRLKDENMYVGIAPLEEG